MEGKTRNDLCGLVLRRVSAASALLVAKTCINLVIKVFCLVLPGQLQIDFKERKFNHKIELVLVCGTYMYRYMQEEIGCPHNMREDDCGRKKAQGIQYSRNLKSISKSRDALKCYTITIHVMVCVKSVIP